MIAQNMGKFRLKLDMSHFYEDERNLVYVLIDPKWDSVIRLEEHVQRLFDVPEVSFMLDDVHIPSGESIEIVKSHDILRAIIPKRKKDTIKNHGGGDEVESHSRKKKHFQERPASSTPNDGPMKKQRVSKHRGLTAEPSEMQMVLDMNSPLSQEDNDSPYSPFGNSSEKRAQETSASLNNEVTVKARKRKRSKKKRSKERTTSPRLSSVPVPISSSTVIQSPKTMRTPGGRHTHFGETQTIEEQESASKKDRITYRCHLTMNDALEPRTIKPIDEEAPSTKKLKIMIQKDLLLTAPAINSSYEPNDSSVIEIDESTIRQEQNGKHQTSIDFEREPNPCISVDKILHLSEPLLGIPKVGEIILFKMYRLTDGCSPTISDYICCRCEEIDPIRETMTGLIIDGIDQTEEIPRISLPNKNTNYIKVFLDELLDKKVFRM